MAVCAWLRCWAKFSKRLTNTRAPAARAIPTPRSVDPDSSTTMSSQPATEARHAGTLASSLSVRMRTENMFNLSACQFAIGRRKLGAAHRGKKHQPKQNGDRRALEGKLDPCIEQQKRTAQKRIEYEWITKMMPAQGEERHGAE